MAVTVNFYTINKKQNSTKQPTGTGTAYNCLFVEPTDMLSPSISLDYGKTNTPTAFNYCYIPAFSRYYYIGDWTYDTGLWYASCSVDALASWRSQIGSSEQYVLRSTYTDSEVKVFNGKILDTQYPTIADVDPTILYVKYGSGGTRWDGWEAGPTSLSSYVVGIINQSSSGYGAVSYFVFAPDDFDTFKNNLVSSTWWTDPSEEAGGTQTIYDELGQLAQTVKMTASKSIINPLQYISSCMWFPFQMPHDATALSSVKFGWFSVNCTCYKLAGQYSIQDLYIDLDDHPQISRGSYLNQYPYTRRDLHFYNWGTIPIDTTKIADATKIVFKISVDGVSGDGVLFVYVPDSNNVLVPLYKSVAQVAVPIQISQITQDTLGALTAGFTVGAGIATAAATGGALGWGGISKGIGSATQAMLPSMATTGKNGSFAIYRYTPTLNSFFTKITNENYDHVGRPLCTTKDIFDLSGYMVIGDADVDFACTPSEKETIINYMEGGFFYE